MYRGGSAKKKDNDNPEDAKEPLGPVRPISLMLNKNHSSGSTVNIGDGYTKWGQSPLPIGDGYSSLSPNFISELQNSLFMQSCQIHMVSCHCQLNKFAIHLLRRTTPRRTQPACVCRVERKGALHVFVYLDCWNYVDLVSKSITRPPRKPIDQQQFSPCDIYIPTPVQG